jgi:SAM-dependent methyltransferase
MEILVAVLLNLWLVRITCTFYGNFGSSFVKLMARPNNLHFLWKFCWQFGAEAWNTRFSGGGWAYGKEPNSWLAQTIEVGTGKALIPADGEGRNAVWIASQGYDTTVFDLSDVGKEKCALPAKERGVEVHYEVDDLELRDFSKQECDLIACSWFHVPWSIFWEYYPCMLSSLKPGGEFILKEIIPVKWKWQVVGLRV